MKLQLLALGLLVALGACAKSSDSGSASSTATNAPVVTDAATAAGVTDTDGGGKVYQTNCSSCHQANGTGVTGVFPPLAGNPIVTGDSKQLIHIVKYGLTGKIVVLGQNYNGMMPNWGQQISNAEIAEAITYIRSSWGNKSSAVTEAEVAGVSQ